MTKTADKNETIQGRYEDVKNRLADDGLSEQQTSTEASLVVKPHKRDIIYKNYSDFLKMMHFAEKDTYHKQIIQTKKRFLNEGIDDPVEAIDLTVKKRKLIIQKATDTLDDDDDDIIPPPHSVLNEEQIETDDEASIVPVPVQFNNGQAFYQVY